MGGQVEAVRDLLDWNAGPNTTVPGKRCAASLQVVRLLLDHGADAAQNLWL